MSLNINNNKDEIKRTLTLINKFIVMLQPVPISLENYVITSRRNGIQYNLCFLKLSTLKQINSLQRR